MIDSSQYKTITDYITLSYIYGTNIIENIQLMSDHLELSEVPMTDINKRYFYDQIQKNITLLDSKHNNYSSELLKYVYELQNLVNSEYGSVNSFLSDNDLSVSSTFADISGWVGFIIDSDNIIE